MAYDGITPDAMWLLAQNKFNNSKQFYEEHKQEIKSGIIIPMRQIAQELIEQMYTLDDKMDLRPVYMVSRIRRDTRFSQDKHLYRDNVWMMFMRNKHEEPCYPCMWFEIMQNYFSYGVGSFYAPPAMMEIYRQELNLNGKQFLSALKSVEKTGAEFECEHYKKPKPNTPKGKAGDYYNVKNICFIKKRTDFELLKSKELITVLKADFKQFEPMYKYLKNITEKYLTEEAI